MSVTFSFKEEKSAIFGTIYRPIALVSFQHQKENIWRHIDMIVDTGADYTLLPIFLAPILGVDIKKDCQVILTYGIGGKRLVYLFKKRITAKLGEYTRQIPIGFLSHDDIPPLLGRQDFFETFRVIFEKYQITFE